MRVKWRLANALTSLAAIQVADLLGETKNLVCSQVISPEKK